jgi:hypothetical protein
MIFHNKNKKACYLRKSLRFAAFMVVVQAIVVLLLARASYAAVNEAFISVGAQMLRYPYATHQDEPHRVYLNGLALQYASGSTDQPVDGVLDYFHTNCRKNNGRLAEQFKDVIKKGVRTITPDRYPLIDGVLRYGSDQRGFVACLDMGTQTVDPKEVIARVQRFLETSDLAQIGELRYVMAERLKDKTHFVAFWTDGAANLKKMFPLTGDAPGQDIPDIPRPLDSRRILSAWESNHALAILIYSTDFTDESHLMTVYQSQLEQSGWRISKGSNPRSVNSRTTGNAFVVEKRNQTVTFTFSSDNNGKELVTVAKMN